MRKTRAVALSGAVWRAIFSIDFLRKTNIKFNTDIKFSEDNLFMMEVLPYCDKMIETKAICHHYVQHGEKMTHIAHRDTWKRQVEIDASRAREIMKAYLSKQDFLDSLGLQNTFQYTANEYAFNAINLALKSKAPYEDIVTVINNMEQNKVYPFRPISEYKEYPLSHLPIARLKWNIYNDPFCLKVLSKIINFLH